MTLIEAVAATLLILGNTLVVWAVWAADTSDTEPEMLPPARNGLDAPVADEARGRWERLAA